MPPPAPPLFFCFTLLFIPGNDRYDNVKNHCFKYEFLPLDIGYERLLFNFTAIVPSLHPSIYLHLTLLKASTLVCFVFIPHTKTVHIPPNPPKAQNFLSESNLCRALSLPLFLSLPLTLTISVSLSFSVVCF